MKTKKTVIYALILSMVIISGLVFANREIKGVDRPLSDSSNNASLNERKRWEASPDGIKYKKWEASPEGKNVHASNDRIKHYLKNFENMEAVVKSDTFSRQGAKSSSPKWLIVEIDGSTYMMQFTSKEFRQLSSLKVDDKIIVRSHSAGFSPNHPYLIVSGDYIEQNKKVIFKRDFNKNNGC
ncbi:MAG: hypothetical protein EOP55_19960 [Sphingobacteriales bacterium]|nr:MAG: hypothetical protein EOP55_19960 [Sphingobacteriales bacterium]